MNSSYKLCKLAKGFWSTPNWKPLANEDAVHAEQVRTKRLNGITQMEYKFEVKKKLDFFS